MNSRFEPQTEKVQSAEVRRAQVDSAAASSWSHSMTRGNAAHREEDSSHHPLFRDRRERYLVERSLHSPPSNFESADSQSKDTRVRLLAEQAKSRMLEEKLDEQLALCTALCQRTNSLESERAQLQAELTSAQNAVIQCEELCIDNLIHYEAVARTVMMLQECELRSRSVVAFLRWSSECSSLDWATKLEEVVAERNEAQTAFMALHEAVKKRAASSLSLAAPAHAPATPSVSTSTSTWDLSNASTYRDLQTLSMTVLELSQELDHERATSKDLRTALDALQGITAAPENSSQRNSRELFLAGELATMKQVVQKEMENSRTVRESEFKLRKHVTELADECQKLNVESLELHQTLRRREEEDAAQRERHEKERSEMYRALEDARAAISRKDSEISTLRSRVLSLEATEMCQKEDLRSASIQIEGLQNKVDNLCSQTICGEACRDTSTQLAQSKRELAALKHAHERLEQRLQQTESAHIPIVVHKEEMSSLAAQLQEKQQYISVLEKRAASSSATAERSFAALQKTEEELSRVSANAREQKEELCLAKTRVNELKAELNEARGQHGRPPTFSEARQQGAAVDSSALDYAAKQLFLAAEQIDELSAKNEALARRVQQLEAERGRKPSVTHAF